MRNKLIIFLILVSAALFSVELYLVLGQKPPSKNFPSIFKKTSFSAFIPGKTTQEEVVRAEGNPATKKYSADKEYFYYDTKNSGMKDEIIFQSGKELFALENVFDSSQGSLGSFRQSFGEGEVYFDGPLFKWLVFINNGLAVQTDGKEVLKIIYFSPTQESFSLVVKEYSLTKEGPSGEVLRP